MDRSINIKINSEFTPVIENINNFLETRNISLDFSNKINNNDDDIENDIDNDNNDNEQLSSKSPNEGYQSSSYSYLSDEELLFFDCVEGFFILINMLL